MPISRDAVLSALRGVPLPGSGHNIVEADLVRALTIEADKVRFVLEVCLLYTSPSPRDS